MLGYSEEDLDEMIGSIQSALVKFNPQDDEWEHQNLNKTMEFLQKLWDEGYFNS